MTTDILTPTNKDRHTQNKSMEMAVRPKIANLDQR